MKNLILTFVIFVLLVFPLTISANTIIDNGDNGTSEIGVWQVSGAEGSYGENSLYCKDTNATYTYETSMEGYHKISFRWTFWNSRAYQVPVKIYNGDTLLDTVIVNQKDNCGQWNTLGIYMFTGTAKIVVVSSPGNLNYSTCADAVQFENLEPVTVPVTVTWDYEEIEELSGFTLRVNKNALVDIPGADTRSWAGHVVIFKTTENVFDMQAYQDDTRSEWSEPCTYIYGGESLTLPVPTGLTIQVTIEET